MKSCIQIYTVLLMLIFCTVCDAQIQTESQKDSIKGGNKDLITSYGPTRMVRFIKQDRKGNIWLAASEGVFKYDGKSFANITSKITTAPFFSVLEDKKGIFWFASIGSGVYYYNGKSLQNLTKKHGLAGNAVNCIYEDRIGNIWFGTELEGASCYNGRSFQNFTKKEGLPSNDVNTIIEDKTGKFWFGTRGEACIYDGKTFTVITNQGRPFTNVRSIIQDKKGNIWLGGKDGLWRYDGHKFVNIARKFVGYIYEDKNGNIWTSSESEKGKGWTLSRYEEKSLSNIQFIEPTVTEIKSNEPMMFGILEADDGSIWFGSLKGVYRYDGKTFNDFKG